MNSEEVRRLHKIKITEELWLNYFNKYLYTHEIITKKEYAEMTKKISVYCTTTKTTGS